MNSDKNSTGDLLWLIMVGGLALGGLLTAIGLMGSEIAITIVGLILLAFGGGALFTRLNRK